MPTGYVSAVINAPASDVWALVRNFNGLPGWLSIVIHSEIEDGMAADQIGCVRDFTLDDGAHVRERLLELSDEKPMRFTYEILESPHRVENYVAQFRCFPITDGDTTFVDWAVTFDCLDASENNHYVNLFEQDVYMAGFNAIRTAVER